MSKIVKLVGSIIRNPKNVSFDDLDKVLKYFGYEQKQPRGGSSHYVYRKKGCNPITVPKNKPIKKCYVIDVTKILDLEEWYDEQESS